MSRATFAILAAVVLLPIIVRPVIATEIWIFAIFGLGTNLLMGYTGLLSFGQATFFGSGAYVAGYLLKHYGINAFVALGVGIGVGSFTVSALLLRPFSGRLGDRRGRHLPIAAGALYPFLGLLLSPILASAAMTFSSVSVIANALRLRRVSL